MHDKEKWEVYAKFQEIEKETEDSGDTYEFFDKIKDMLTDEKSYIRVRGFRLICKFAKWDRKNKINECIDTLLSELDDEKPTNVRQCLRALEDLILYKPELKNAIKDKVLGLDYSKYKESMSPLVKKDINGLIQKM